MAPTGHKGAPTVGGIAVALLQSVVLQLRSYSRRFCSCAPTVGSFAVALLRAAFAEELFEYGAAFLSQHAAHNFEAMIECRAVT